MANFVGRSGSLLLFVLDDRGVVVDSDVNLIVASGKAEPLQSSRSWAPGEFSEESHDLADSGLSFVDLSITADGSRMYTIPKAAQAEAKKALEWRKEEGRGGTSVGINTARTLAKGGQIGIEKVRHISKYFARHEVDKKGKGWKPAQDGFPSNGRIAWALWGGDAAWRWARAIVERENKKSITADGYGIAEGRYDYGYPTAPYELDDFKVAQEAEDMVIPEFLARVRLDGSGFDRLYKIDLDGNVYVWDDGVWDNLGYSGKDIWVYDNELDDPADARVEKSHIVIDPSSAITIAARLLNNPYRFVTLEQIDAAEADLANEAIPHIDWEIVERGMLAAGEIDPGDGIYTEEERSANASKQVRDATGKFTTTGSRVMIGGDARRGLGQITKINPGQNTVEVKLDNGKTVTVPGNAVEDAPDEQFDSTAGGPAVSSRIDTSGILGEPRTPINSVKAQLPGTLPAMTDGDLKEMLSNWPAWVNKQRSEFKPASSRGPVPVQGKNSLDIGNWGRSFEKETGKQLIKNAYDHPLLNRWLNSQNTAGEYPNRAWYNPITAAVKGEPEKAVSPETTDVQPIYMAVVDKDDPRAVLELVAIVPASDKSSSAMTYKRDEGKWVRDTKTLQDLKSATPPPVVPLDTDTLQDVLKQVDQTQGVTASLIMSVLFGPTLLAAGGLDRNRGNAEKLRRYWTVGKGAAKIRWGTPGDWKRCVRHLSKYMGVRSKGYCQLRHKEVTGVYTGSKLNPGNENSINEAGSGIPEEVLYGMPESMIQYEIPKIDLEMTLDEIIREEDDLYDDSWDPEEEIVEQLRVLGSCDDRQYALLAAGGLDRNQGKAEELRRYWTVGKGGAKIRWGTPGDWTRCVRNLSKYLGTRSKGYCALRHKEVNGVWPGEQNTNEYVIMASGTRVSADQVLRSEEEFIALSELSVRSDVLKARVAGAYGFVKRAGQDVNISTNSFFFHNRAEVPNGMENTLKREEPFDEGEVYIEDLIPSQKTVNMRRVSSVSGADKPVMVLITENGPVLIDGHHRTVSRMMSGSNTIPAKIYKMSETY
jgi:hypothetical protein